MCWRGTPGIYPRTLTQCRKQGQEDFRAGLPITWTPNLGPSATHRARQWWLMGWLEAEAAEHRATMADAEAVGGEPDEAPQAD